VQGGRGNPDSRCRRDHTRRSDANVRNDSGRFRTNVRNDARRLGTNVRNDSGRSVLTSSLFSSPDSAAQRASVSGSAS
jgi:hypothetical protein